jgi:L-malate glycosyltransferase
LKNKLHVLFICGWYPSRVLPTNGDFIQRHAETVALKNDISVLHIITDPAISKKIEISSYNKNNVQTHIAYIKKTWNPIFKIYLFLLAFFRILKLIPSFNIIHLNSIYPFGIFALYLKTIRKTPYIITEHWTDYYYPINKKINRIVKILTQIITFKSSVVCPVTEDLGREMINFGLKGNYKDIPNVVDTSIFKVTKSNKSTFKMIHISSMFDDQKNITGILETIKALQSEISNFEITFIGGTGIEYTKKVKDLELNTKHIKFLKHCSQSELSNHLAESDVFILFSNFENLPCVILESFCSGTPVISTDIGGISQYFPNNFGSLIRKNNKSDLKSEILKFYKKEKIVASPSYMNSYVQNNFGPNTICDKFTKIYFNILN